MAIKVLAKVHIFRYVCAYSVAVQSSSTVWKKKKGTPLNAQI